MSSKSKSLLSNENEHLSLAKKVEAEQQKLTAYEQRVAFLEDRRRKITQENEEKQVKLEELKEEIKKYKHEENPIIRQLREHFKALREELGEMEYEDEGDDIDIDNMSYEQLLELEERIGKVSKGISAHKFQELEKFTYEVDLTLQLQQECTICRDEFEDGSECVKLGCMHFFHCECLKEWLKREKVCPNCKTEIS